MIRVRLARLVLIASTACALGFASTSDGRTADCQPIIDQFNRAVDAGLENEAQVEIDKIAISAKCGQSQVVAQRRLAALRLSAAQILMARGRPVADYDRPLNSAESMEVLWQASATLGERRCGERKFVEATQAYDRVIEIVKNETLTPPPPERFEIEGLMARAAQARLLAANAKNADGQSRFVQTARDHRDGTLGGIFSRSVRGTPQTVSIPITFDHAKTTLTSVGELAADKWATALKEQRPDHIKLVGHPDVRGSAKTNLKRSAARSEAVDAYMKEKGKHGNRNVGRGANEPLSILTHPVSARRISTL
jgi:outer membrane protein OmpA-like peptidoglycan-associated protein